MYKWLGIPEPKTPVEAPKTPKFQQLPISTFFNKRAEKQNQQVAYGETSPEFPQKPNSRKKLFSPHGKEPFPLSRTKIENFKNCPRCFYMNGRFGVSEPPGNMIFPSFFRRKT
jgi:hypothetical protein